VSKNLAYGKNSTKKYCWLTFPQNGTRNNLVCTQRAGMLSERRDSPNCGRRRTPVPVGRIRFFQMLRVIELSGKTHQRGKSLAAHLMS